MLKYFTKNALLLFAISILLVSCKTAKKPIKNLAYQYQKNSRKAKIEYLVHHQNADTSTIYLKMPAQNLTFDEKKATQLQTQIKLYEQIKEGGLLDTFFRNITVKQNEGAVGTRSSYNDGTIFYLVDENVFTPTTVLTKKSPSLLLLLSKTLN